MTDIRWEGFTHEEIYARVQKGPGRLASTDAEAAWTSVWGTIRAVDEQLTRAMRQIGVDWQGPAADGVGGGMRVMSSWASEAANHAIQTRDGIAAQAVGADYVRHVMPSPRPELDKAVALGAAGGYLPRATNAGAIEDQMAEDRALAVDLMNGYTRDAAANQQMMNTWTHPPSVVVEAAAADPGPRGAGPDRPVGAGTGLTPAGATVARDAPGGTAAPAGGAGAVAGAPVLGRAAAPGAPVPGAAGAGSSAPSGSPFPPVQPGVPGGPPGPAPGGPLPGTGSAPSVTTRRPGAPGVRPVVPGVPTRPGGAPPDILDAPGGGRASGGSIVGGPGGAVEPLPRSGVAVPASPGEPPRGPATRGVIGGETPEAVVEGRLSGAPTARTAGSGGGFLPFAGASVRAADQEHRRPTYLVDDTDVFADDRWFTPPVIAGDDPEVHRV